MVFLRHGALLVNGTPISDEYDWIAAQGATGVSFFFILSGFVLAWTYRPNDPPTAFWRRRVARIVPAYLVAWALGVLVFVGLDHIHDIASLLKAAVGATLLQAWVPDRDVYYGSNGPAWSLSTEVFFYALFPLIIGPIMRINRRALLAVIAVATLLAIVVPLVLRPEAFTGLEFWTIYINPVYRLLEFVIGLCLCALIRDGLRLRIPPIAAVVLVVVAYLTAGALPIYAMWVAVTLIPFALLIFTFAEADLGGRTMLHNSVLIRLGQWSFAFYLMHFLVIRVAERFADNNPSTAWHLSVWVVSLGASIGAAYLLYRFVEYPLERRIRDGGTATPPEEWKAVQPAT